MSPIKILSTLTVAAFNRVITIGSPHNGARLLRYLLQLSENSVAAKVYPVLVAKALVLVNIAQNKFDPFGEQIQALNDPNGIWKTDPDAQFHLIRTTTNSGLPPTRAPVDVRGQIARAGNQGRRGRDPERF